MSIPRAQYLVLVFIMEDFRRFSLRRPSPVREHLTVYIIFSALSSAATQYMVCLFVTGRAGQKKRPHARGVTETAQNALRGAGIVENF